MPQLIRKAIMPRLDMAVKDYGAPIELPEIKYSTIVRQEIHCHECQNYVQFDLDEGLNGNHVLYCPLCNHEHCRVVKNGEITGERWDSRNGPTFYVNGPTITTSGTSQYMSAYANSSTATGSGAVYTSQLWMDTAGTTS